MRIQTVREKGTLLSEREWQEIRPGGAEYLSPAYYERILKPYTFKGVADLELFRRYLKKYRFPSAGRALEFGPGPGRVTDIYRAEFPHGPKLDLVDLSSQMLAAAMGKYGPSSNLRYVCADIGEFIVRTSETYDLIFAAWSFSHSMHQALDRHGTRDGLRRISRIIERLLCELLRPGGRLFLLHFDALSEEQRISLSVRRMRHRFFHPNMQSPCLRVLNTVGSQLFQSGELTEFKVVHFKGDPIIYHDSDEALETFFNFHMEAEFNAAKDFDLLQQKVRHLFRPYMRANGRIAIRPGCFQITAQRAS